MGIVVDHDERQREILIKALKLFGERGYPDVTYQQIATVCGLSRTTLYKYFQNKRQIFGGAIMYQVAVIGRRFQESVNSSPDLNASEKLNLVLSQTIDLLFRSRRLLQAILDYLIDQRRQDLPVARRIRRHTVAFRRTLKKLVQEGIDSGLFRVTDPDLAANLLYGLMESASLRITLIENTDPDELQRLCRLLIQSLEK
ncbi:MAG: TetR/AcrR family transcriptional regulator [Lentisphaerae bacterium]|nr:TetR/AcrR family transcriptional regulator [Lentisphaerota bacterium]